MHLIIEKTPFGKNLVVVRDPGDTKKREKELNREILTFGLKYGFFGENLSDDELIQKWGEIYG